MKRLLMICTLVLSGCTGIPKGITPVEDFDVSRYLGTWYEIARLDHSFERGLNNVTAMYAAQEDGGITVVNRGFNPESGQWKEADGKAYFIDTPDIGRLKVSFIAPFYGAYNIIALDKEDYTYSLVCGLNRRYLWVLAREPKLDEATLNKLIDTAKKLGFETDKLIFVSHERT